MAPHYILLLSCLKETPPLAASLKDTFFTQAQSLSQTFNKEISEQQHCLRVF
jgi:hypothetical protein